ncbi:cell division protein ZapA [bacterium]|nr:cell division protein ZapA [bacterium]
MDDDKVTTTRVSIFGDTYNIRTQTDPEYTRKVAEYVNQTMQAVKKSLSLQDVHKIAILAAMSITDELFQTKREKEIRDEELELKCNSLIQLLDSYLERSRSQEALL